MPRSIKPQMSRDEMSGFDAGIHLVEYHEGEALITVISKHDLDVVSFWLNEQDCEKIIQFIRRNKL